MKNKTLPKEYIDFNQNNSGTCWLIRPTQSLNYYLSHRLEKTINISISYIYLMNLKSTVCNQIHYGYKTPINGGGCYRSLQNIVKNKIYQTSQIEIKLNIYDRKVTRYIFKTLEDIVSKSRKDSNKDKYIKEVNDWINSLYTIHYEDKSFEYAVKYLSSFFFEKYFIEKNTLGIWWNKDWNFTAPYHREDGPLVGNDNFEMELYKMKALAQLKDPPTNIKTPYCKEIRKSKEVYGTIQKNVKLIEEILDKGDVPMISFLYSREQRYNMINGYHHVYARHLAMIESYDNEHFIIRDTRDNMNGEYTFKINKDKLIFLSRELTIFYLSKLK